MNNCKVIAIANQKGGVGKTTTTFNLGVGLVRHGKRVLLIDFDPQGDLTICCGIKANDVINPNIMTLLQKVVENRSIRPNEGIYCHPEGVNFIPANIKLTRLGEMLSDYPAKEYALSKYIDGVKSNYDYIIIDCMPGLGIATVNAFTAADSVIIPVQSHYLPLKGMVQLVRTINNVKREFNPKLRIDGILLTLVARNTNLAYESEMEIRKEFGDKTKIFNAQIPVTVRCAEISAKSKSIYAYKRRSKAAKAYNAFTEEVIELG